jgi:hypothetical protein
MDTLTPRVGQFMTSTADGYKRVLQKLHDQQPVQDWAGRFSRPTSHGETVVQGSEAASNFDFADFFAFID